MIYNIVKLYHNFNLVYRQDEIKWGTCVGVDKYGNKYFENNYYFYGKLLKQSVVVIV